MHIKYRLYEIKNKIKWAFQRMRRGYDDSAVWNMDGWFIDTMRRMLRQLQKEFHSYPVDMTEKEWSEVLGRMIFLLREMDEDKCTYKNPFEEAYMAQFDPSRPLTKVGSTDLDKLYFGEENNKFKYMDLCKEEFFDLFSKHFYNLWD